MHSGSNSNSTYYDILGVTMDADEDTIRKSYYKLQKKYHPDRNGGGTKESTEMTQRIGEAYKVLGDAASRKKYGQYLALDAETRADLTFDQFVESAGSVGYGFGGGSGSSGTMAEAMLRHFFGDLSTTFMTEDGDDEDRDRDRDGDPNSYFFGAGGGGRGPQIRIVHMNSGLGGNNASDNPFIHFFQVKPPPVQAIVLVSFEHLYRGYSTSVEVDTWIIRKGVRSQKKRKITITVPAGDDSEVVVKGCGNVSEDLVGDVHCAITLVPHPIFQKDGDHLLIEKTVTLREALCGAQFEFDHLNGKSCSINSRGIILTPGYEKVYPGLGFVRRGCSAGNLIVRFCLKFPTTLAISQMDELSRILADNGVGEGERKGETKEEKIPELVEELEEMEEMDL